MAVTKITDAGIRKVITASGYENNIKAAGQGWALQALTIAHMVVPSTHSEAQSLAARIVTLAGQPKGVAMAKVARLHPYSGSGGLASQFAAGKFAATFRGKQFVGLHAYSPIRFAERARLGSLAVGDALPMLVCSEHGTPDYSDKGSARNGANYPNNKGCTNACKVGVNIGASSAYDVLTGKVKAPKAALPIKATKARKARATRKAKVVAPVVETLPTDSEIAAIANEVSA